MTINEAIKSRRTIRRFENKPIPQEKLESYINMARLAPSGTNLQPLKYTIISEEVAVAKMNTLVKWAGYIRPQGDPPKGQEPTAFIAVMADLDIKKAGYEVDMGAAVTTLIYSALEDGVGACWMGAIDYPKITELLELDESKKLLCVVALGYKAEEPVFIECKDGNIKYFKDENGVLNVPKRPLDEVIIKKLVGDKSASCN